MERFMIDDMDIVIYPTFGERENGPTDETAMITYRSQSLTISLEGRPIELVLGDRYIVVLNEKQEKRHYKLVDPSDNSLVYMTNDPPTMSLKEALSWKNDFLRGRFASLSDYNFYSIMRKDGRSMDWLKSYMPKKRSSISKEMRERVYAKCDGHCAYCGKPITITEMQVDHVDSHYRHQGKDEIDNYLPACRDCNGLKSDYLLEEFRTVLIPNSIKKGQFCGVFGGRNARIAKAYGLNKNPKRKIIFYFERKEK